MIRKLIPSLYDSSMPLPQEADMYKQILVDAEYFALSPQIYFLLQQRGVLSDTPLFFQQALIIEYKKTLYQNIFIKKKLEQILAKFEEAKIPVIPLKGVYFAEKYFGHVGARGTSDIDLLIKRTDLKMAIHCISSLGFTIEEEPIPSHFHASFSKLLPHSPIPLTVELHWDLLKNETSQLNIEEFWSEAKPIDCYTFIMELSDYHAFYMICLHGWRHHLNSLKHFLDILQMAHILGHHLDYERLFKDAFKHKTLNRLQKTLAIVYAQFPDFIPAQGIQFTSGYSRWWEYQAIRDSNYRTYRQYVNLFCFEFLDYDSISDRIRALYKWFIPPIDVLLYELGSKQKKNHSAMDYLRLYKHRFRILLKTLF